MENNRTAQTHIGKLNIQFKAETSLAEDKSATIIPLYKNSAQFENFHDEIGAQKDFTNERGRTLVVPSKEGTKVYLNMGKPKEMNEKAAKKLAAPVLKTLLRNKIEKVSMNLTNTSTSAKLSPESVAAILADGMLAQSYSFNKYQTQDWKDRNHPQSKLQDVDFIVNDPAKAEQEFTPLKDITESAFWCADLANEPANKLTAKIYASRLRDELQDLPNMKVKVLRKADIEDLGMGGLMAVNQGSAQPPRVVIMEYDGTNGKSKRPFGMVGKGLTHDNGGISLKPSAKMEQMKMDMHGSATVVGTMRALAKTSAPVHVVAVVLMTDNKPDGNAVNPGDVITHMNGMTTEIINTDAEGRLVLADGLSYIQKFHNPHTIVDVATLTGAVVMALGHKYSGVFTPHDKLWEQMDKAGKETGELSWRLPLHSEFHNALHAKHSDLLNVGGPPGASAAAEFLHHFIEKDAQGKPKSDWVHDDIAGASMPPNGVAFGYGVRKLTNMITTNYAVTKSKKKDSPAP